MMRFVYVVSVVLLAAHCVLGKRYCRKDEECEDLGELTCIKSMCDYGVCGCPRKQAAKYLGSDQGYKCVPVKKIGESCSNDGDGGVCGAAEAYCKEETHECTCKSGMVPKWGGERCAPEDSTFAGETCSPENGIGACSDGTLCVSQYSTGRWYQAVGFNPPTCACPNTAFLDITNFYSNPFSGDITPMVGYKQPQCHPRMMDEPCWVDEDCPMDAVCTDGACECEDSALVPDYLGVDGCKKPLDFGDKCVDVQGLGVGETANHYTCDGNKGLVCGDMCGLKEEDNKPGTLLTTCTCGPFHKKSGSSCTLIDDGASCHGDFNCKGFSPNGICVDGTCRDSVGAVVAGLLSLIIPLLASALHE